MKNIKFNMNFKKLKNQKMVLNTIYPLKFASIIILYTNHKITKYQKVDMTRQMGLTTIGTQLTIV